MYSMDVNAKINLSLNIDGFDEKTNKHIVQTVMAKVDIYDTVTVTCRHDDGDIYVNFVNGNSFVDCNNIDKVDNTAYKMAKLMQTKYRLCGFDIDIVKGIPIKSGLGGSSADAAGVFNCIKYIFDMDINHNTMYELASQIGADVPFLCTDYSYAYQDDRNKSLAELTSNLPKFNLIVLSIGDGISSKQCFEKFGQIYHPVRKFIASNDHALIHSIVEMFDTTMATTDSQQQKNAVDKRLILISKNIQNALYEPALAINPKIADSIKLLKECGATAINMTGSGSACYGIFEPNVDTNAIVKQIANKCEFCVATSTLN